MPNKNNVPLMFRAQVEERCQLQYTQSGDIQQWKDEWISVVETKEEKAVPAFADEGNFGSKEYSFSWRFVTNGGQDDGIIRPVIGAFGLPFYPGSSMKGAFCQACTEEQRKRYGLTKNSDEPSLLRFHGGYPVNDWKQNLVDIVHPQQKWQVKTQNTAKKPGGESGFGMISLARPTLKFTISSLLPETDWQEVWQIWEKALGYGIGCRVSSGYGWVNGKIEANSILKRVKLRGRGVASQLFNGSFEFRANIFKAALRGHALRIFGGLNQASADDVVDELFGGIRSRREKVGLLGITFQLHESESLLPESEGKYDVKGDLVVVLFGKLMEQSESRKFLHCQEVEHGKQLTKLVEKLIQFAMLLGGFGKSWRRAYHPIFYQKYTKHLIGCHWEWGEEESLDSVGNLNEATQLINDLLTVAEDWLKLRGFVSDAMAIPSPAKLPKTSPKPTEKPDPISVSSANNLLPKPIRPNNSNNSSPTAKLLNKPVRPTSIAAAIPTEKWRENWSNDTVQVWGRVAENETSSLVIHWLHSTSDRTPEKNHIEHSNRKQPEAKTSSLAMQRGVSPHKSGIRPQIYRTTVTGRIMDKRKSKDPTAIGRLWHRMYPVVNLADEPKNLGKCFNYLELLTIFPDNSDEFKNFVHFLKSEPEGFHQIWPISQNPGVG